MSNNINEPASLSADLAGRARDLASRADALAAEIGALHREIRAAVREPVRRAGFRCDTAAGSVRQATGELRDTAADLDRISAASAPSTCSIPWGVCPEHGNTLVSTAGKTWCREWECQRRWDYDRAALPCPEPARWTITDQSGGTSVMCDGHAFDATRHLEGARVAPLMAADQRESALQTGSSGSRPPWPWRPPPPWRP
jgi:hypothetical protein